MSATPRIALIIGSTRATRFADIPAQWMLAQAQARTDMSLELLDLRDYHLPMFDEMASNAYVPSQDSNAVAWQKKLAEFDGYTQSPTEAEFDVLTVGFGTIQLSL